MTQIEFESFRKIPRLFKNTVTITEKIDGTNAQVFIQRRDQVDPQVLDEGSSPFMCVIHDGIDYIMLAGSRTRWLGSGKDDNFGFGAWVSENRDELLKLGPGRHYGEWWGAGIQRGYGLDHKRFSLFNVHKWNNENKPSCCHVVPVIAVGSMADLASGVASASATLGLNGSLAAPGFKDPEGICLYFSEFGTYAKYTFDGDNHKERITTGAPRWFAAAWNAALK